MKQENPFFITENEQVRGGAKKQYNRPKFNNMEQNHVIIEEENTDPNIDRRSKIESQQENMFDEDFGRMKMERFKA